MNIRELLHLMIEKRASDLHLKEGRPPMMRIDGKLFPLDMDILSNSDLKEMIYAIMDEKQRKKFEETNEMDLAYNLEGVARYRANVFKQMGKLEMVMRAIPIKIPSIEELNLPSVLNEIALYPRGLVLVTGTTGSGKSTTLAAMINKINENYNKHIVTIEDPIEFVHTDKKSSISQREVGLDTDSFASALKYVLRQDPDVILIGEMRDVTTVGTALSAAETGHMVFSTLHTMDTIQSINRILDFFPKEQQNQIRIQLAGTLRAVISLRLIKKSDGTGMVPAVEVMIVTPTVRGYIEEGKLGAIKDLIREGNQFGMQTFDQSLINLYKKGLISLEEAKRNATSIQEIELALKGITSSRASAQSILDNMLKEQAKKELNNELKKVKDMIEQKKTKEAYEVLEKLYSKYPDSNEITEMLENIKRTINRQQYEQTLKDIILEGLNIYKKGNIQGAIVKWQEGLNIDPENQQLKGYIKSAQEKLDIMNNLPKILNEGLEIYKKGNITEAINKWEEVLKIDPNNKQAINYITGAKQKLKELRLKKEIEGLIAKAEEEIKNNNDLAGLLLYKRAYALSPANQEIDKKIEEIKDRLLKQDFGGTDVEAAITAEAFHKGIEYLFEEDYISTIREWKKALEKRPLEKKLKDYIDIVKDILKKRLEELMEKTDLAYRERRLDETIDNINNILKIDPTNEFALKFMRDIKSLIDEEVQKKYKEAIDMMEAGRLKETKEMLLYILKLDPNHMSAKKRLEEVNESLSKLKDAAG
ncbi:MAG: PilT/PilU family type 4a pilus ATPase [Candidatus Goldbacteria bacterium]|nr:PilT/PilU family type 4a pilus ATPase [Candidatus Goldiibacteriota bacterium]